MPQTNNNATLTPFSWVLFNYKIYINYNGIHNSAYKIRCSANVQMYKNRLKNIIQKNGSRNSKSKICTQGEACTCA